MQHLKYHVLLNKRDSESSLRVIFRDLSERDLKRRFLAPYRRAGKVLVEGEAIDLTFVSKFKIIATAKAMEEELEVVRKESFEEVQRTNRESSSVVFISAGWGYRDEEIEHVGADVTAKYLISPPGEGGLVATLGAFLNHPWILAIGAGLVVAWLVFYFGWS